MNAIDNLMEYRNNKEKYLPMIDHETEFFPERTEYDDVNIGWDCGFIGNRPYFLEAWATSGITMISIFLSTTGIEDYSVADLEKLLIDEGKIYSKREGYESPEFAPKPVDSNGNEFFSVNIVVGVEDEPAKINGGGHLVPFSELNKLNGYPDDYEEPEDEEPEVMTYEEAGFRGVYHKLLLFPLDDRQMRKVLADFPGIDKADSYLGYGYIDHDAGVTVEILALAKAGEEIEYFEPYTEKASTKVRMGELVSTPFIIVPGMDDECFEKILGKLEIINEGYKESDEIHETRCFDFLDEFRDPVCIDDVEVLLYKEDLKLEKVWVRIEGTKTTENGAFLVGKLLVEPYQDYGVHKGDEVVFNMQNVDDEAYCVCVIE